MMEPPADEVYHSYTQRLLADDTFIAKLQAKVNPSIALSKQSLQVIVDELAELLEQLVKLKLEREMSELIDDNNRILEEIKSNFQMARNRSESPLRRNSRMIEAASDASFTDIHRLIAEQKKKMNDQFNDADLERSISMMEQYEDVAEKVNDIQKRVKGLQDKYQTNFKSLWNVLSMTEAAVFQHIKENREKKPDKKTLQAAQKKSDSLFTFWK